MRLDNLDESQNVDDRRSQSGGGGGFSLGGGGGKLGLGMTIVCFLAAWMLGINPSILIGGAEILTGGSGGQQVSAPQPRSAPSAGQNDADRQFLAKVLFSTEQVWSEILPQQMNIKYTKPPLVMFSRGTGSGCGSAQSAMGPFYCPVDKQVYIDTVFFQEMKQRLGGGGDFAYAYVIAHEVGHHVENLLGILPKVQQMQQQVGRKEANALSVRVELMADCLAGVWAHHSEQKFRILEQGDIEEAMRTASAIGDDALQKQSQGYAVPDSFTHGSSDQRMQWFTQGFKTGQVRACDTFNQRNR